MSKGRTKYFWIGLFFIHLFFLFWQIVHEEWLLVDSHDYVWAAKNLKSSGTLFSADMEEIPHYKGNYTRRPPVYPIFLATNRVFSTSYLLPAIFQLGFSLLGFFLFLKIFQKLYPEKEIPFYLLIFLCLYPAQYIYANLIMAESLFQLLLMVSIYFLLLGINQHSLTHYIWHSLFLVFSVLTKPVLYLLIPLHLLYFGVIAWKKKKLNLMLVGLIPVLLMSLYVTRNYQRTEYLHFSSVQNINLFQFPVSYVLTRELGTKDADRMLDEILIEARSKTDFKEEQVHLRDASIGVLTTYPATFFQLHIRGMLNYFLDPGRFDLYHFFSIENDNGQGLMAMFGNEGYTGIFQYFKKQPVFVLLLLGIILILNLVKFVAFLLFPFYKEIDLRHRLILTGIVLYLAGVTGVMGASRFAMPCFYLLLLTLPAAWMKLRNTYLRIKSQ